MTTCESCENKDLDNELVIGRGNPYSKLMIVGEAPGASEALLGEPFVGRSGRLLDDLLKQVGIDPLTQVYLCNVVKSRPPKNRAPTKKEIQACMPWLRQQIYLVDPKIVLLMGATAVESILGIKGGLSKVRGQWKESEGRLVMPMFHPSYLLRNPSKEKGKPRALTLADLKKVREKLVAFDLR